MKTDQQNNPWTARLSLITLVVVMLLGCSPAALAQWVTNGANINNTNTGNVGIGTTTPGEKLQVKGNTWSDSGNAMLVLGPNREISFQRDPRPGLGNAGWFQSNAYLDASGNWLLRSTGTGAMIAGIRPNLFDIWTSPAGAPSWTQQFSVTSTTGYFAGNVGIGTTAPGARLDLGANPVSNQFYVYNNGPFATYGMGATVANGLEIYTSTGLNKMAFGTYNQTTFTPQMVLSGGNVGIGTSTPAYRLDVQGQINVSGGICIAGDCKTAWSQVGGGGGSSQWTTSGTSIYYNSGNVGLGTISPSAKLHVVGNGRVTGDLTVDGIINAKYQDVAEWVPAAQPMSAGTVVVLDPSQSNHVMASGKAYDTRIAGVVSERPGLALGESGEGRVLVATTGRVRVKVDATRGSIAIGDLLVTSDMPGVAMKSEPVSIGGVAIHRSGTLIGKALEPLAKGSGEILVLLSLQ